MQEVQPTVLSGREIPKNDSSLLLVFGQGPVIDKTTRLKASEINTPLGDEDINFWSKNMVEATSVLVAKGDAKKIVVMGGRTGGDQFASEAELISNQMVKKGIPLEDIIQEKESLDTIENLVNFLNLTTEDTLSTTQLDILCSSYHATRLKILFKLFTIPIRHVLSSEEIMRFAATTPENNQDVHSSMQNQETVTAIDHELEMNKPNDFYTKQKGTEKRDIVDRKLTEDALIQELLSYPEKWLPLAAELKSDRRLMQVLKQAESLYPEVLMKKYGIDSSGDLSEMRKKLRSIVYTPIPVGDFEQWKNDALEGKAWPKDITQKFNILIQETNSFSQK